MEVSAAPVEAVQEPDFLSQARENVKAAEARVLATRQELASFRAENYLVIDSRITIRANAIDARPAIDQQHHRLVCECDRAIGAFHKALQEYSGLRK